MASVAYPTPSYNGGGVTQLEYERLANPQAPDGCLGGNPAGQAMAYADGTGTRTVWIRANRRALVRGFVYESGGTAVPVNLPANTGGADRIDLIVLRLNRATWTVREDYQFGFSSLEPPAPLADTGSTGFWDFPLATARVGPGVSALSADKITPVAWYVGDDGQIQCTPTTRPPHDLGRVIWEHNPTGLPRQLVSNGAIWLAGAENFGQSAATAQSGYTLSNNVLYRRSGFVFCQLTAARNALMINGNTHTAGIIPADYRPPFVIQSAAVVPVQNLTPFLVVQPTGEIQITPRGADIAINNAVVVSSLTWPAAGLPI